VTSSPNPFGWLSLNAASMAGNMVGIRFNRDVLKSHPAIVDYKAKPSENDKFFYNDGEKRTFPSDMYLGQGVSQFGWYTAPYNDITGHSPISRQTWLNWASSN